MEKALEDLELHKEEAEFSITKTAERCGLSHTTLQRKYNQETRTNAEEAEHQNNLTTQHEEYKRLDFCWLQWVHFGSQEHHRTS
jgi:AraC-like DNA-binding protein